MLHSQDIQKRCESIVKMVEKEMMDIWKAEEIEEKKASTSSVAAETSEVVQVSEVVQG